MSPIFHPGTSILNALAPVNVPMEDLDTCNQDELGNFEINISVCPSVGLLKEGSNIRKWYYMRGSAVGS